MKTRPHIVTQKCVMPTSGLYRCADGLAKRIKAAGDAGRAREMHRFSALVIRVMKIILDLTLHNNCFERRRDVLASPKLRARVAEQLGGAPALERWRRKNTWNKARLAAIASGEYKPPAQADLMPARRRSVIVTQTKPPAAENDNRPAPFRLPVLQNLRHRARPRVSIGRRAARQARFPSVVIWPHELDGQYVPGFASKATRPAAGGYAAYAAPAVGAGFAAAISGAPP